MSRASSTGARCPEPGLVCRRRRAVRRECRRAERNTHGSQDRSRSAFGSHVLRPDELRISKPPQQNTFRKSEFVVPWVQSPDRSALVARRPRRGEGQGGIGVRGQPVDKPRFHARRWIWISFRPAWISFSLGLDFLQPRFGIPSARLGIRSGRALGAEPAPPRSRRRERGTASGTASGPRGSSGLGVTFLVWGRRNELYWSRRGRAPAAADNA